MISRVLSFARRFLVPHASWLVASIITGLITSAASGLGVPLLIKFVFPIVFNEGDEMPLLMQYIPSLQTWDSLTLLLAACAVMPTIFAIRGIAMWANHIVVNVLGIRILTSLRTEVFSHVQQLPMSYLEGQRKGDIVSRIVADTGNVQNVLSHISNDLFKQPITCLCAFAAFMYMLFSTGSGQMALVLLFIVLAAWPIVSFGKRITLRAKRAQAELGELNTVVQQNLETQREVRAYALEEREISDFHHSSGVYRQNVIKLVKYQRLLIPVMETVTAVALAFLLISWPWLLQCSLPLTP